MGLAAAFHPGVDDLSGLDMSRLQMYDLKPSQDAFDEPTHYP